MASRIPLDEMLNVTFAGGELYAVSHQMLHAIDDDTRPLYSAQDVLGLALEPTLDESKLLIGDGIFVFLYDLESEEIVSRWRSSGEGPGCISPSPDGSHFIVVGSDEGGTVKRFEFGQKRARKTRGSLRYGQIAWLDDETFVCLSSSHQAWLSTLDHELKGEETIGSLAHTSRCIAVTDGDVLVGSPKGLAKVSLHPLKSTTWWNGPEATALAICDDGRLAVGTRDGLFIVSANGKRKKQLGRGEITVVAVSSDRVAWIDRDETGWVTPL